jgi:hypothetical protein
MGLLAQGFKPEVRDALGYTDQTEWDVDDQGKAKDPWNFTNELPLADPETGEQMTFSASSKGGIGCIGNLCKAYAKERAQRAGLVPIIELGRDSYKHPTYGKTYVPVLAIVDWVENGSVPAPAQDDDQQDADPAPEPKKATAAGGRTRF